MAASSPSKLNHNHNHIYPHIPYPQTPSNRNTMPTTQDQISSAKSILQSIQLVQSSLHASRAANIALTESIEQKDTDIVILNIKLDLKFAQAKDLLARVKAKNGSTLGPVIPADPRTKAPDSKASDQKIKNEIPSVQLNDETAPFKSQSPVKQTTITAKDSLSRKQALFVTRPFSPSKSKHSGRRHEELAPSPSRRTPRVTPPQSHHSISPHNRPGSPRINPRVQDSPSARRVVPTQAALERIQANIRPLTSVGEGDAAVKKTVVKVERNGQMPLMFV